MNSSSPPSQVPVMADVSSTSMELNTPIKRIMNLKLTLPQFHFLPRNLTSQLTDLDTTMTSKGYLKKLTNNVLDELEARTNEITKASGQYQPSFSLRPSKNQNVLTQRKKRYLGIHRSGFHKMDLISSHYAASRPQETTYSETLTSRTELYQPNPLSDRNTNAQVGPSPEKRLPDEVPLSVTKRRKTLLGPEEVLDFSSPTKHNIVLPDAPIDTHLMDIDSINSSPVKCDPIQYESDIRTAAPRKAELSLSSSPFRKISPSKRNMNLNKLLNDGPNEFLKPRPVLKPVAPLSIASSKPRISSLQMAGVKPPPHALIPVLNKKPLISKISTTEHSLTKKKLVLSIQAQSLSKKPLYLTLQEHQLKKKSSIPTLNPGLRHQSVSAVSDQTSKIPTLLKKGSMSSLSSCSKNSLVPRPSKTSLTSQVAPKHRTLYSSPTISSSQKLIDTTRKPQSRFLHFMKLNRA